MRTLALALLLALPLGFAGASRVAIDPLAGHPEGTYVMEDGRLAIPLRAPTPSSYTPEIHQKVLQAAENGNGYDPATDSEVALSPHFLFIRPGAWMWSPSWCTMNFIYGTPGNFKIGSAGHCNAVGQDVVLVLMASTGTSGVFVNIGKTEASHNNGVGDDYSITAIRSNFQAYVDANVAVIGGPQGGAYTGSIYFGSPLVAKHFGHGNGIGTGGTPRVGLATYSPAGTRSWYCECAAIYGDSGSGVLVTTPAAPLGQALGVLTHLVVGENLSLVAGTRSDVIPYTVRNGDIVPLPPA
jgi:hypothetical protein